MNQGFVADTKDGITAYQLATVKMALKLEAKGMQMRKGPKLRKPWAIKLGLKSTAPYEEVIAKIETDLAILVAKNDQPLLKAL